MHLISNSRINKIEKQRKIDILALCLLVIFSVFYIYTVKRGIHGMDESFYFTVPHRLIKGDRFLVDEWHIEQFSALFQYLPTLIFYKITKSTEGIILFMRYLYVVGQLLFSSYLYTKLRKFGWTGLFGVALFCTFIPAGYLVYNYYTVCITITAFLCVQLFIVKKFTNTRLILFGFLFACSVLAEPTMTMVFVIYTVIVVVFFWRSKKKKLFLSASLFNLKTWFFMTLGILICSFIFLVILSVNCGLSEAFRSIPNLFLSAEYSLGATGKQNIIDLQQYFYELSESKLLYPAIAAVILSVIACLDKKRFLHRSSYILCAGIISLVAIIGYFWKTFNGIQEIPIGLYPFIPVCYFGLFCYFFTQKPDRDLLNFWIYGFLCSIMIGIASDFAIGFGYSISTLVSVPMISQLFGELQKEKNKKENANIKIRYKLKFLVPVCTMSVVLIVTMLSDFVLMGSESCDYFKREMINMMHGDAITTEITRGPLKGIKTLDDIAESYDLLLNDLDILKERSQNSPVCIVGLVPYSYLYLDSPYATSSAWFNSDDFYAYTKEYWQSHSDKRPSILYVPNITYSGRFFEETSELNMCQEFLTKFCNFKTTKLNVGYIIEIDKWNFSP